MNTEQELVNRLMPHGDRYPLLSRDWETVDCNATRCIYNQYNKCTVPSLAIISEEGKCLGYTNEHT